ncbi:hypothetical protein [Natrialba asiatica]|uniref:Uncharacterized protein n=1 Tax=Natrialba asiatica (strain ATCC 700177 / DSM 12278 / JCM 9576 / FERM P-10747 / NBRC 102637 / 172P1) TaxID=29540 RepID=M0B284_NATA1|nr:hypothetical protein [Natrialba asiatica]ELZ04895.1 hypothetical protein C481_03912 [Natrialba asiatica DSM 12278]
MRLSIPGVPGVYYDTDAGTTALATLMSTAGRRAPKPSGYAVQFLPYLWSFDVDLHEVPNDHPIQYLHPESAVSLGELTTGPRARQAGTELESVLRFAWSVNQEVESATNTLLGNESAQDGVTIEIQDGSIVADGDELATDEFDIDAEDGDRDSDDDSVRSTDATREQEVGTGTGTDADTDADSDAADDPERFDTGSER